MLFRRIFCPLVMAALLILAPAESRGLGRALASRSAGRSHSAAPPARYLVLIVLDGARPDYLGLTRLPHLDALIKNGTQYSNTIDGILESETPAGHTALTTGSTPRRDGILGFNWAQNDNDYSLFSPTVIRSGAMEHIMEQAHVPTIAGLFKKRYPSAKVVALSGHKYYAADPLGGPQADAIMYYQGDYKGRYVPVSIPGHTPPASVLNARGLILPTTHLPDGVDDSMATRLALATFHVMHQRVTLINEPEFDWPLGHVYGGILNRAKVIALMQSFDRDLGRIERAYRRAGILSKTLFVITADHGMSAVTRFISDDVVKKAVAAVRTTAPSIAYNHSAYIWLKDGSKARAVADGIMRARDPGVQSVYYLTTIKKWTGYLAADGVHNRPGISAAYGYLLNTLLNGHQPSVVAFARSWATFSSSATHWKADHGGATWQSQHIPLIFSGPGIRKGAVVGGPAQLDDVAPTLLQDMGVNPAGMEGHVLTDALASSSAADQQARNAEIKGLTPIIQSLAAQQKRDQAARH
ncbi:MAG TPA: alkaline phosphatase family protein [Chloroflexota bacterium]